MEVGTKTAGKQMHTDVHRCVGYAEKHGVQGRRVVVSTYCRLRILYTGLPFPPPQQHPCEFAQFPV